MAEGKERLCCFECKGDGRVLHFAFKDLETAYEKVVGEELRRCRRKSRVSDGCVGPVQGGGRQLRAPSLSTAVTDRLTDDVGQESARTMFGDDTLTYRQSGEQVVEVLKRWRKLGNDPGSWRGDGRSKTVHVREASGAGRQVKEERREEWKNGEVTCLMHFLFACFLARKTSPNIQTSILPDSWMNT